MLSHKLLKQGHNSAICSEFSLKLRVVSGIIEALKVVLVFIFVVVVAVIDAAVMVMYLAATVAARVLV